MAPASSSKGSPDLRMRSQTGKDRPARNTPHTTIDVPLSPEAHLKAPAKDLPPGELMSQLDSPLSGSTMTSSSPMTPMLSQGRNGADRSYPILSPQDLALHNQEYAVAAQLYAQTVGVVHTRFNTGNAAQFALLVAFFALKNDLIAWICSALGALWSLSLIGSTFRDLRYVTVRVRIAKRIEARIQRPDRSEGESNAWQHVFHDASSELGDGASTGTKWWRSIEHNWDFVYPIIGLLLWLVLMILLGSGQIKF